MFTAGDKIRLTPPANAVPHSPARNSGTPDWTATSDDDTRYQPRDLDHATRAGTKSARRKTRSVSSAEISIDTLRFLRNTMQLAIVISTKCR